MTNRSIKIEVNLDGLIRELQQSLQRIIYLVASGLNATKTVTTENLYLPGKSVGIVFENSLNWNIAQLHDEFNTWLLLNGFRDSLEAISSFLESAHKVLSFWELADRQKKGKVLTGTDWHNVVDGGAQKYHRYGFPDKLDHLKTDHRLMLEDKFIQQVLSINHARNCLVHRNGIVTERDLNIGDKLEVKWSRMAVIIQSDDGEKEFVHGEPVTVYTGNTIGIQNREEKKQFALSQQIQFSSQEFGDITWGLFIFGNDLVMKIKDYGLPAFCVK